MMNVVGIKPARAAEYQRAGSTCASFTAAALRGVSTNASICPGRYLRTRLKQASTYLDGLLEGK
jgi:hypothetical protein